MEVTRSLSSLLIKKQDTKMIQNIGNKQNASKYLPDKLSVGAISRFSIPEALELMKEQTGLKREQIKLNKMNEINNNNETANGTKPVLGEGFDYVITFGKYKGKTLVQILDESPSYIIWLSENDVVKIPDDLLIMACHDTMSPDFEDLHSDWGCLD